MPKLEGELPSGTWKFVRDGEVMVYEETDGPLHSKIAAANNLGEAAGDKRLVDDAGIMGVARSSIWVSGVSTSCVLRQPIEVARVQTKGILEHRTGKTVDIQE